MVYLILDWNPAPCLLGVPGTAAIGHADHQRLATLLRDHTRDKRSVTREEVLPDHSSLLVAAPLLRDLSTPSQIAAAREVAERR